MSQFKGFFEIETVPELNSKSTEEQNCEEFFNRTVNRNEGGRLQLQLPFKTSYDKTAVLGKSKQIAL